MSNNEQEYERLHDLQEKLRSELRAKKKIDPKERAELLRLIRKYHYSDEIGMVD